MATESVIGVSSSVDCVGPEMNGHTPVGIPFGRRAVDRNSIALVGFHEPLGVINGDGPKTINRYVPECYRVRDGTIVHFRHNVVVYRTR